MEPRITGRKNILHTPYFTLVGKTVSGHPGDDLFYAIESADYVTIVAITKHQELVMVRQFRPAVEQHCLELPAGTVDDGESPLQAARRELLEETGYVADEILELGCLMTDSGRMSNRMWYFFASNARPDPAPAGKKEEGMELVLAPRQRWPEMLRPPVFRHALQMAGLFLAESAGRLDLPC